MKNRNKLLGLICSLSLFGCQTRNSAISNQPEDPVKGESKILVSYFSWSGNTKQLASWISEKTGGELFRIVPEVAYQENEVFDCAKKEHNDGIRPPLSSHIETEVMAGYDTVFLGFPIWWYDLPMPVWTFLEEYDFSGKTVIPFFSHNGSSSGAGSLSTVKRLLPNSTVSDQALSIAGSRVSQSESQVDDWLNGIGYAKDK